MAASRATLVLLAAAAALLAPPVARAECAPGREVLLYGLGADAELLRLAGVAGRAPAGSELIRRAGARAAPLCAEGEAFGWSARLANAPPRRGGIAILPLRLDSTWAARYPIAANDGLLWAGRGFSVLGSVGAYGRWGPLSASLAPELAWQQNAWFRTAPTGLADDLAFENPWYAGAWDGPQRFGAGPFWAASPGQSFVRLDAFGVGLGLSTENRWLGPGARHAILLTGAGPGFPHAFLGTSAPVDILVGRLEALALWGRLDRSRHARDRSQPWFTALALGWEPRWTPGFHVGAARAFVQKLESLRGDAFLTILEPPWKAHLPGGDNPQDNQLAALWFRWLLPASALELYGEWGKDDFPASIGALIRETEQTQAWILGLQKLARAGGRPVRVQVELAKLAGGRTASYEHGNGLMYSHLGQPLGAYAGPGGVVTSLAVDVLGPTGRLGGWLERLERNVIVFDQSIAPAQDRGTDRDTEITVGVRQVLALGWVELAWEAAGSYRWNRDFIRNEPNARLGLSLAVPMTGSSRHTSR